MKRPRFLFFVFGAIIVCIGFLASVGTQSPRPVLEFVSYETPGTNAEQFAKLVLRNTTGKSIWLYSEGPLASKSQPRFLRQRATPATRRGTNNITIIGGSYIVRAEEVLPGTDREMEFTLYPGNAPEHAGIYCYTGNIKDASDLFRVVWTPTLKKHANLKDKIEYYWDRLKWKLKDARRYEVWCPQLLSYQTEKATNSMKVTADR